MAREYRVLSALYQAFPYAPRAFLMCEDLEVIGAPFFVMERRRGIVVRRTLPDEYASITDAPRRMSEALIGTLASFHAVDYAALGLRPASPLDSSSGRSRAGINAGRTRRPTTCRRWTRCMPG
jgi:aminoglycoside phosphotransferase (APT) family kinase protein